MNSVRLLTCKPAFCVLAFLVSLPCALAAAPMPDRLTDRAIGITEAWDYRVDPDGGLWVAYYDDGELRLRGPDDAAQLVGNQGAGGGRSGLALAAIDNEVAVLWRDKMPRKALYVAQTPALERPLLELGADTEPLARIRAEASADALDVVWLGEKPDVETSRDHHLYHRRVDLATGELSPVERLFPGIYPVLAVDEQGALLAVSWFRDSDDDTGRIVARVRETGADAFGDPVTVAAVDGTSPIYRVVRSGERWLLFWVSHETMEASDFVLEGAHSDDQGKTWKRFTFEDLRGLSVSSLDVAADEAGHIAVAVSVRRLDTEPAGKDRVYLLRSDNRGSSWHAPQRLRTFHDADQFRARYPSVSFGAKAGSLLVVWEDWREIRSRLYASLSDDYGATWRYDGVPLPHPPQANMLLSRDVSAILADRESFHILAEQALDDRLKEKFLVRMSLTEGDLAQIAAGDGRPAGLTAGGTYAGGSADADETPPPDEALRRRVTAFWDAMVGADYKSAYHSYDPFFQSRFPLDKFLSNLGKIKYGGYSIKDIRVSGARAEVDVVARASVGPFRVPTTGETISRPEQEVAMTSIWLWVDDDWYREFRIEAYNHVFTDY